MFQYEEDLIKKFISHLESNTIERSFNNIYREFNYSNGKTDIIAESEDAVFAFEAKLNKCRKAINQAYRNTIFADYSYVVLPEIRQSNISKYELEFEKYGIGLILVNEHKAFISISAKKNHPGNNWIVKKARTIVQGEYEKTQVSRGCTAVLS